MAGLEITNKDWIDFNTDESGRCILKYNIGKLITPKNEDADIAYIILMIQAATEINNKAIGEKNHIAHISLENATVFTCPIKLTVKIIRTLQEKLPTSLYKLNIYDAEEKYIFIWDSIKGFMHKDTLVKTTIYTKNGKKITNVENLEKNLSN